MSSGVKKLAQVVVGAVIVVAAVLAARARRRLKAVLLVGLVVASFVKDPSRA